MGGGRGRLPAGGLPCGGGGADPLLRGPRRRRGAAPLLRSAASVRGARGAHRPHAPLLPLRAGGAADPRDGALRPARPLSDRRSVRRDVRRAAADRCDRPRCGNDPLHLRSDGSVGSFGAVAAWFDGAAIGGPKLRPDHESRNSACRSPPPHAADGKPRVRPLAAVLPPSANDPVMFRLENQFARPCGSPQLRPELPPF